MKKTDGNTGTSLAQKLQLAAIGMEAEFSVFVDGEQVKPEDVFKDPRSFLGDDLMHRRGTSYHLPTGGAVYFDTGVIEVATPVIEIERGCAARAGRSLWEGIRFVRAGLDDWEKRRRHDVRLVGFSTHYNISFDGGDSVDKLALLLAYILPAPVMLLATNRKSSGVGVRPRGERIEVTVDFTPDAALMIATGTLITGIVREVMKWPTFELAELERRNIPVIDGFKPMPHTTRKGWLARYDCYPRNPFTADVNETKWRTTDGRELSLRALAGRITHTFWHSIKRISDPFTFRLIGSVIRGRAPSLLDLPERPEEYDDVGRLCTWDELFPTNELSRSRYERVLIRAISGEEAASVRTLVHADRHERLGPVVFRRDDKHTRHHFSIDFLLQHLRDWERPHRFRRKRTTDRPAS
jgi:hypothetical protein